jgi:hypothetical protein
VQNPIIVFAKLRERFVQLGDERLRPMAWNEDGTRLPPQFPATERLLILVLDDDDQDIPTEIGFANADATKPLLIVWHKGSYHHKISQLEKDPRVLRWGITRECATFSHNDNSSTTWKDVNELICGELDPIKFAQKYRARSFLDALERWAAICQLYMIGPDPSDGAALGRETKSTLETLPEQFSDPTRVQLRKAQPDWPELLKQVRDYAAPLAREQFTK